MKTRDLVKDYFFTNWKYRQIEGFNHHLYQFKVWKKSMKSKFIAESAFLVIITLVFQYYLIESIVNGSKSKAIFERIGVTEFAEAAADTEFSNSTWSFYIDMQATIYFGFIILTFPLRIVLEYMFARKLNRKFQIYTTDNIIDISLAIVFAYRIMLEYVYYRNNLSSLTTQELIGTTYYKNIYILEKDADTLAYLYSIASTLLWIKILLLLRVTRLLGPLIKMIQRMINDIMIFMILFSIQLIIFATVATLLFTSLSTYSSFNDSMLTLFQATLGSFDYTTIAQNSRGETLGDVFLTIFLIMNMILFLNLLIAILSTTYSNLWELKNVLYINEILKLRSRLEYDKNSSALVSTFAPFNIVAFAFMPLILYSKQPKRINKVLFHIEYIPLLILILVIFIAINLIMIPFAWLKVSFVNIKYIASRKSEIHKCYIILRLIVHIFFGLPIMLLNLCSDCIAFVHHCYQDKVSYRKVFQKACKIKSKTYECLLQKFESEHHKGTKFIDYKDMVVCMRSNQGVYDCIRQLIFSNSTKNEYYPTHDECIDIVNDFVHTKNILFFCSFEKEGKYVLNFSIMRSLLMEVKHTYMIKQIIGQYQDSNKVNQNRKVKNGYQDKDDKKYLEKLFFADFTRLFDAFNEAQGNNSELNDMQNIITHKIEENFAKLRRDLGIASSNEENQDKVAQRKSKLKKKDEVDQLIDDYSEGRI